MSLSHHHQEFFSFGDAPSLGALSGTSQSRSGSCNASLWTCCQVEQHLARRAPSLPFGAKFLDSLCSFELSITFSREGKSLGPPLLPPRPRERSPEPPVPPRKAPHRQRGLRRDIPEATCALPLVGLSPQPPPRPSPCLGSRAKAGETDAFAGFVLCSAPCWLYTEGFPPFLNPSVARLEKLPISLPPTSSLLLCTAVPGITFPLQRAQSSRVEGEGLKAMPFVLFTVVFSDPWLFLCKTALGGEVGEGRSGVSVGLRPPPAPATFAFPLGEVFQLAVVSLKRVETI